MLHERWSAEAWAQVRVEFRKALALRLEQTNKEYLATERSGMDAVLVSVEVA